MAAAAKQRPSVARRVSIWTLVVLGAIVITLAAVSAWVRVTALDNGTWTRNSGQLLEQPAVRAAIAGYVVDQLFSSRDVNARIQQALPPRLEPLAAPLAGALQQAALRGTTEALARPRVQALWRTANDRAHQQLVAFLKGKSKLLQSSNGAVTLDLAGLITTVAGSAGVGEKVAAKLQGSVKPIVLIRSDQLGTVQKLVKVLNQLSVVLIALAFALWAGAVALARNRRREIVRAEAVGLVVAGLLVLVIRRLAGGYVVDTLVKTDSVRSAVNDVWGIYTADLRSIALLGIVYGILGLVWVWLSGAQRHAVAARRWFAPIGRNHPGLVHAALAAAILLVVYWAPLGHRMRFFTFLVLAAILFVGLEVLRRQSVGELAAAPAGAPPEVLLAQLQELHDRGALTDDEFEQARAALAHATPRSRPRTTA